ncbi:hypothetical protein HYH03_004875 [Edaphochlamys debaryana]|uniref:O-fucosyltransferase family protein n=1 Tax=Edaphochlamys debaryana TaxID=47281 RepID=A0A836C2Y3_9CHLO|nr:hypothetical protein HYH03_004875 [Edaphochlamys debaryana]|eukprot:KAG2497292.1 hypothetical protein HYH03_004875 [Edaphochlamys debaryana]
MGVTVALIALALAVATDAAYLIPFMWHGPNNQINTIKETLALAKVLGRTTVLPDLQSHMFTDKSKNSMRFKDLFDLPYIKEHADVILLEELEAKLGGSAWDRTLDAVLYMVPPSPMKRQVSLITDQGFRPPADKAAFIDSPVTSWTGCSEEQVAQLKKLLEPHSVVGVQTFHGLIYGSHWLAGPLATSCTDACCQSFKDRAPAVRKASWIYALADAFIHDRLGGKPFVAAHVRPYPDPCVRIWTQEDTPKRTENINEWCNNEYLIDRFAPSIKHLLQQYGVDTLFIMTHPRVRTVVEGILHQAGLQPVFMEMADVNPELAGIQLSTNLTFSLLAMVEEAVCAKSKAFVGTKESSMTGTIIQDRLGHGVPPEDSYSFFRREGFEAKPVTVPDWYRLSNYSTTGSTKWRQSLTKYGIKFDEEPA